MLLLGTPVNNTEDYGFQSDPCGETQGVNSGNPQHITLRQLHGEPTSSPISTLNGNSRVDKGSLQVVHYIGQLISWE